MDYKAAVDAQREYFYAGETMSYRFRIEMLKKLRKAITDHEDEILSALKADLNKPAFEGYMTEVGIVLEEITYQIRHLKKFMAVKKVKTPLMHFPSKSFVMSHPLGVVLVMSPWNYPFQLTLAPLVGVIAAGNCAVVKPSRYSGHTAEVIRKILSETFDSKYISVFLGGSDVNTQLLDVRFDHIFFTGGPAVGKIVMEKAAGFLCPVTLELGGKSPCIVDETADLRLAAKRILWGKCLNSGQTCVAPDYLLVHKSVKADLVAAMKEALTGLYGEEPLRSTDYCKIINSKHYERLKALLADGNILLGGKTDDGTLQIAPTLMDQIDPKSALLTDEVFGPILPILEFDGFDDMIGQLKRKPKPLAFYLFTTDKKREKKALADCTFGGGTINDTVIHLTNSNMGFGGVGESGMGGYHGQKSFDTFSHHKSVMKKSNRLDIKVRYAPYKKEIDLIKKFLK